MKNGLRVLIPSLVILMLNLNSVTAAPESMNSLYQLLDDESDRMAVNPMKVELDPVSLGLDAASENHLQTFLTPSLFIQSLSEIPGRLFFLEENDPRAVALNLEAGPAPSGLSTRGKPDVLLERAKVFEKDGLIPVAREQYAYVLKVDPQNKPAAQAMADLSRVESEQLLKSALSAKKSGDLETALDCVNRVLAISPQQADARALKKNMSEESALKKDIRDRIAQDYAQGVELYQNGRWDSALASFVQVLNLDPSHKDALAYVEKIGTQMNKEKRP